MKRTQEEIVRRIENSGMDFFGVIAHDLLAYLEFDFAKPYLNEDTTVEQWGEANANVPAPLEQVKEYLPFAWRKANDCRGLSASRSIDHIKTWLWLAGFDIPDAVMDNYEFYGKPQLVMASVICGFDWPQHDNQEWKNAEDRPEISAERRRALVEEWTNRAKEYTK